MTDEEVRQTISTGTLQGSRTAGIDRFLGIPYAQPPFGENRFALPLRPEPWAGVRDATAFGPTPPQAPYQGAIAELLGSVEIPGDDILTVNVWAPHDAQNAPVILWIHGGALERGTAAMSPYDGTTFARDGVVFVSINYRLGSEGFSVLTDVPRNLGVADAGAALDWVRREIATFGGDPARITLMGESAGGAIVAALLARPQRTPGVSGAIIESGPLAAEKPEKAGRVTADLAKRLGIETTREAFLRIAPQKLVAERVAQAAGSSPLGGAPAFALSLDSALPTAPERALSATSIPILIGTNTDEYRLWFSADALSKISPLKLFLARMVLRIPRRAASAVRRAMPDATTGEVFGQLASDVVLRAPMLRLARSRSAATFVYEFAWNSPVRGLRAAHALELGFVFDALADPETHKMTGPNPPQTLADEMHSAWARFAGTGNPGWPEHAQRRLTRIFDDVSSTEPVRRAAVADAIPAPR